MARTWSQLGCDLEQGGFAREIISLWESVVHTGLYKLPDGKNYLSNILSKSDASGNSKAHDLYLACCFQESSLQFWERCASEMPA